MEHNKSEYANCFGILANGETKEVYISFIKEEPVIDIDMMDDEEDPEVVRNEVAKITMSKETARDLATIILDTIENMEIESNL